MKTSIAFLVIGVIALSRSSLHAGSPPIPDKEMAQPTPPSDPWVLKLSAPGWLASVKGTVGIAGNNSNVSLDFGDIVRKIDMVAAFRTELSKGRFGIMTDFSYLSSSDGIGSNTILSKIDARQDQTMGDLGFRWRLIENPKGYLDVIGGVRYTSLYEAVQLHPNFERIDQATTQLAADANAALRAQLAQQLVNLADKKPTIPIGPLSADEVDALRAKIAAIRGNQADRQRAIEKTVADALSKRFSRTDYWLDPYIGLRGRYNFTDTFYFTGRADIGGFDVGAKFVWQTSAGFGVQLKKNVAAEAVYRILDTDYRNSGFVFDTVSYGAEVSLIITF